MALLIRCALAIVRQLQCVAPGGLLCSVRSITAATCATGRDGPQTLDAFLAEPPAPQRDGLKVNLQVRGNLLILVPSGRRQNDPTALRHLLRGSMRGNPAFQFQTILRLQGNRLGNSVGQFAARAHHTLENL